MFYRNILQIDSPDIGKQRNELSIRVTKDRQQLIHLEDNILKLLFESEGNILDNEAVVDSLNEAKEAIATVLARLVDSVEAETAINIVREKYRPLAVRGAILFFIVTSLSTMNSMYQFSYEYFTSIFRGVISSRDDYVDLKTCIEPKMSEVGIAVYENISRGMFDRHKVVFRFLMAVAIERSTGIVKDDELDWFLKEENGLVSDQEVVERFSQNMKDGDSLISGIDDLKNGSLCLTIGDVAIVSFKLFH